MFVRVAQENFVANSKFIIKHEDVYNASYLAAEGCTKLGQSIQIQIFHDACAQHVHQQQQQQQRPLMIPYIT
jgi:hypothetical protein